MAYTSMKSIAFGAAAGIIMAAGSATPGAAAGKTFCKNYANKAVIQYANMQARGLGCTGPRWHAWWQGHYSWCRTTIKAFAKYERKMRRRSINNAVCML